MTLPIYWEVSYLCIYIEQFGKGCESELVESVNLEYKKMFLHILCIHRSR